MILGSAYIENQKNVNQNSIDKYKLQEQFDKLKAELLKDEQANIDKKISEPKAKNTYFDTAINFSKNFATLSNGFNVSIDKIKQADINDGELNKILKTNYGNTDILLSRLI